MLKLMTSFVVGIIPNLSQNVDATVNKLVVNETECTHEVCCMTACPFVSRNVNLMMPFVNFNEG